MRTPFPPKIYTALPEITIENTSDNALSRVRFYINGERREIAPARNIALSQLNLNEGVYTIHLRGARGLDAIQFAYLPNLKLRLDKNEYRANESPQLFINNAPQHLPENQPRRTISYNGYSLIIPIPLFAWRLTDANFTSEPLLLSADKLPSVQNEKYLEVYFGNRGNTPATLHFKRGDESITHKTISLRDGHAKLDLASHRDIANVNLELDFIFTVGKDDIPILRTFKEWTPKIQATVDGRTVTLALQDNAEGFKNRELVVWNTHRLWEKPMVISILDSVSKIEQAFEHDGEYGVQARIKRSGWGKPKELTPFDVPSSFNASFKLGTASFKDVLNQREQILLDVLINHSDLPIVENEFIAVMAYRLKEQERDVVKKWIHLFLALPEGIRNRFQAALYSETHDSVKKIRFVYEEMIKGMVNNKAYITQLHIVQRVNVELSARLYQQNEHDGFMLKWKTNADSIRKIDIMKGNNLRCDEERFVQTDSLKFYTLICARRDNALAIATVAIARKPLIVCFQAVQLNNTDFKLIWRVIDAQEVEIYPFGKVEAQGECVIQPQHGATYTLVTLGNAGRDVPTKTIKTEFAKPHIENFEILYSRANRVYVKLSGDVMPSALIELSFCRNQQPLSNLDDLLISLAK